MSQLATLIPSLQRFLAPPGEFETLFPTAGDEDLVGSLGDGFAECQLRGFFSDYDLDPNAFTVAPDMTVPQGSLVVLFAGVRILMAEIRNRKTHLRQQAGTLSNEVDQSATVLAELLKEYQAEKKELIAAASIAGSGDVFVMADAYFINATTHYSSDFFGSHVSYHDPYGGLL